MDPDPSAASPRRSKRRLWGALVILVSLALLLVVVKVARAFYFDAEDWGGHAAAEPLLDHPDKTGIAGLTNVTLPSRDGTSLRAWYVPARNGASIVVTTGTDANRFSMLREARILSAAGFGVLAFDWPGTGQSAGHIDWGDGAVAALEGAIDWQQRQSQGERARIGALGFSIGAMETVRVAATDPRLRAVVLEGTAPQQGASTHWVHWVPDPLHSLPLEWASRYYGWPLGSVRPVDLVGRIGPRPVFLIGGTLDINADPQMLGLMCAAAHSPKECWVVPGATHGGYGAVAPDEYAQRLQAFFTHFLLAANP